MASSRYPRVRRTAVAVALTVLLAGVGSVFAAFTATTTNPANSISTGTVVITDSDASDTPLYTAAAPSDRNLKPGDSLVRCVRVTYAGTLPAEVRLYTPSTVADADAFTLHVERGSGLSAAFPACTGFTSAGTVFPTAGLETFPVGHAAGLAAGPPGPWTTGAVVDYRFTVTVRDDPTLGAHTSEIRTADHTYTWEARST